MPNGDHPRHNEPDSLSKFIKTKEQGEAFMQAIEDLDLREKYDKLKATSWTTEEVTDFVENYLRKFGRERPMGWFMLYPFDPAKERNYITTQQLLDGYKNQIK